MNNCEPSQGSLRNGNPNAAPRRDLAPMLRGIQAAGDTLRFRLSWRMGSGRDLETAFGGNAFCDMAFSPEATRWLNGTIEETRMRVKMAPAQDTLLCSQKPIHPETQATATPIADLPDAVGMQPAPTASLERRKNGVQRSPCTVRRRFGHRRPLPPLAHEADTRVGQPSASGLVP